MKNILLVCAAGMSTSLLVNKMKAAAENKEEDIQIQATSGGELNKYIESADVLLLGPQVSYLQKDYKSRYADMNIPIEVISNTDYGTMNGEKVLQQALELTSE
ncbi:PTS sugar transporter subunit IIB [Salibacterium lacus]|uniref:PTS sugar transporter subunit IIB n=1 Tax=Salibacterium lacus TaxID=1898109 RepID=A0ABW5T4L4_9BACI